jgi:hypothetical protein
MPKQIKTEDLVNGVVKMKVENGASNKTILDFLMNNLGYGQSYSYEVMREARKKIQEIWDKNAEAHLEEAKAHLEELYENAIRKKDMKLALQVRQELNKLMGLYSPEKLDITSNGQTISEIKIIEIRNEQKPGAEDNTGVQ